MADVSIATQAGALGGHLATPTDGGPWPGLVVIHEAFGLNDDIRRIADRFAEHGYLALAPDFFAWGSRLACVRAAFRELDAGSGRMFDDLDAARAWVAGRQQSSGQVGVIGFCLGGGFALLAAPRSGYGAASVNYGRVPGDAERVLAGACPIVASYGAKDRANRGTAQKLDRVLATLGVDHDVKEYADAGHAFLNDHEGAADRSPLIFVVMGRFAGPAGYHEPSAKDARQRIVSFFDAHLKA